MISEQPGQGYAAISAAILRCTPVAQHDLNRRTALTDLGLDSLGVLELMLTCEADLGVELLSEEAPELRTVGDVGDFIDRRLEVLRAS
jgi:acyl carrier protein